MNTGIHSMSWADYQRADGVSQSDLKYISDPKTPAHYKAFKDGLTEREETPAMVYGSLVHRCILEPETVSGAFVVKPDGHDGRTKDGKAWNEANSDRVIITKKDADSIRASIKSVWNHPIAAMLLRGSDKERSVFAEEDGLILKSRFDMLTHGGNAIPDLKTCEDASPEGFASNIERYGYDRQAAFYLKLSKLLGLGKEKFVFICVEKSPPYLVAVYQLDDDSLRWGELQIERDLTLLRHCTETGRWPGYSTAVGEIGLPEWKLKRLRNEGIL